MRERGDHQALSVVDAEVELEVAAHTPESRGFRWGLVGEERGLHGECVTLA